MDIGASIGAIKVGHNVKLVQYVLLNKSTDSKMKNPYHMAKKFEVLWCSQAPVRFGRKLGVVIHAWVLI